MARSRLNHFVLDWLCSIHSFTGGFQHVESIVIQSGVRNFQNHLLDIRQERAKQMTHIQSQLVSDIFKTISNLGWFQKFLKPFSKKGVVLAMTEAEANVNRLVSENSETNRATMRLHYFVIQRCEFHSRQVQDNTQCRHLQ